MMNMINRVSLPSSSSSNKYFVGIRAVVTQMGAINKNSTTLGEPRLMIVFNSKIHLMKVPVRIKIF
jgi:hypothetical protein